MENEYTLKLISDELQRQKYRLEQENKNLERQKAQVDYTADNIEYILGLIEELEEARQTLRAGL